MKIVNQKIQALIRAILGIPKAPDEVSERMVLTANIIPVLVFNNISSRYETMLGAAGRLFIASNTNPTRITTATTTVLSAQSFYYCHSVIVNAALAGTATFRDSAGNTLFVLSTGAVALFSPIDCQIIKDVVTSAAADITVFGVDLSADTQSGSVLIGA